MLDTEPKLIVTQLDGSTKGKLNLKLTINVYWLENFIQSLFRFILSLASNTRCLVVDDQLNILPITSHSFEIKTMPVAETADELKELKSSMQDTQPVGSLLNCCCTLDQVN